MDLSTLAVKAIIMKEGRLLLLQRNPLSRGEDNWDLPGGLVEENEEHKFALMREVKEELGIQIEIINKSNTWQFLRVKDQKVVYVQNYICRQVDEKAIILSEEHINFVWIEPKEISKYNLKDKSLIESILSI